MCGSKGGNCEGLIPDLSTDRDQKYLWNSQEVEADDKDEDKEKHNGNGDTKTTPWLGSPKKGGPSAVEGKSTSKRRVEHRRCSSPNRDKAVGSQDNILAVQDQDLDTQADGTSSKSESVQPKLRKATIAHGPACGTATSLPAEQVWGQGDKAQVEEQE